MSDKQPMQAAGDDGREGDADGIENPNGQGASGQSNGGAYPNPHKGKDGANSGFFGHGGQTHIDYSGPGDKDDRADGNANAAAGSE